MQFTLTPRAVARCLLTIVCALAAAHLAGQWSTFVLQHDRLMGIIPQFSLNEELNVPSFYSGGAILLAAALVGVVAAAKRKAGEAHGGWIFLAFTMLFLSFDEFFSVHERFNIPVRNALHTSGVLYLAWVIPYATLAAFVGVACWKTVMSLPAGIRGRMFVSGLTYVFGAAGMEMLGAPHWVVNWGAGDLVYAFYSTSEEVLEMVGIVMFIHAMLLYLEHLKVSVAFSAAPRQEPRVTPIESLQRAVSATPTPRVGPRPARITATRQGRPRH